MIKKYSKQIIIALVLIELSCVFLMVKSYTNKDIDKIKETSKIDRKMFTMYVEQDDGTYKGETGIDYFPSIGYRINEEKTYCVDHYGEEIDQAITFKDGSITVTGNKTIFCTLYFKKKGDDITVTVSTSGKEGTVPTVAGYKANLTCDTADSSFNEKHQRVEISAATTDEVKCNLDYTTFDITTYPNLLEEVESKATAVSSTNYSGGTDTSYRYTGKTPSNWVWFNNEMWRIIGSIPTCTSSGCAASTNLVKIIRNESIGGLLYDAKVSADLTGIWGDNTLYTLLNTGYYGAKNATSSYLCYSDYSVNQVPSTCDYRDIGILSTSYYGRMVTNVYWNIGASLYDSTAATAYTDETETQTALGYIGLMSLSDYGYAASSSYHGTSLYSYNTVAITSSNWLYSGELEWTNIRRVNPRYGNDMSFVNTIDYQGSTSSNGIIFDNQYNLATRPVLYLNPNVYIIDGSGTQADPYIIGM